MYRGRYDKATPHGYSGIEFSLQDEKEEAGDKEVKNPPTPVENGAGDGCIRQSLPRSVEDRNEIKRMPRDFSGAATPVEAKESEEDKDGYALLSSLFQKKVSIEDLVLVGTALLLASKEENSEAFPLFALALMLLGS